MDVECRYPSTLRNIAIYGYWKERRVGGEDRRRGTRIQVLSLGYGWIWFIPVGPTRTSIGLVVPVEYFKQSGLSRQEIYDRALAEEPLIAGSPAGGSKQ